jgi:DNA-binding XRE family transcriptional regulator
VIRCDPTSSNAPISYPQPGLGSAIRELRERFQLSDRELAESAGIAIARLRVIEAGETDPSWGTVRRIAQAVGVPVADIAKQAEGKEKEMSSASPQMNPMASGITAREAGRQKTSAGKEAAVASRMDADRVARALGHPKRLRLLVALLQEPGSATALSKKLAGVSSSDAHYHLTKLQSADAVVPHSTRLVRGATETTFAFPKDPGWRSVVEAVGPFVVEG